MANFFGNFGSSGNVPLSSFRAGNLLGNTTMYRPNASAGVGSLTGFGSMAPGPGGVPYGDWASKIKPSVPVNSTTGQALLNPQWGNLAQAPDKPWDFSGASGIMSQRGHVVRDGELVPKVSVYGTPHPGSGTHGRHAPGGINEQGQMMLGGADAARAAAAAQIGGTNPYPLLPGIASGAPGVAQANAAMAQIQGRLANPGAYDPANPFNSGLSPLAQQQLRDQLQQWQTWLAANPQGR